MKKLMNVLLVVAFAAPLVLSSCSNGPSPEETAELEKAKADSIAAVDSISAAVEAAKLDSIGLAEFIAAIEKADSFGFAPTEKINLTLGFAPNPAGGKYNVSGVLLKGSAGKNATFALAVYDVAGNYVTHRFLTLNKGVRINLNATQTAFNFYFVDSVQQANAVAVLIDDANFGPDVKISDRNAVFYPTDPQCSIVGGDDARDSYVGCVPSILGDLKGQKSIKVHFEATNSQSGNLIFSSDNSANLKPTGSRCAKTCLNVSHWGTSFQFSSIGCLPGQCTSCL